MEKDLSLFDKNVMELFEVSKNILKASDKRKLSQDRRNPFLARLEKYAKTYGKTEPEEHLVYFENILNKHKKFILLGPQRDSWLQDSEIVISYGEDCGLKTDMKIHLSAIYNNACKMRDEIKDETEGLTNPGDTSEIGYPTKFLLHLYKIFREIVTSEADKTKLDTHISTLESEIGIRSRSANDNPLSGIFDMAEQVGIKLPRDNMPSKEEFGKMFGNLTNNPQAKNMIGTLMQKFQSADNIGDLATTLLGELGPKSSSSSTPTVAETPLAQLEGGVNDEFAE